MDRPWTVAWCAILAIAAVFGGIGVAQGDGGVTVVGSRWQGQAAASNGASPAESRTASSTEMLEPTAEAKASGAASSAAVSTGDPPVDCDDEAATGPTSIFALARRPAESSWYTRFDYLFFKEESVGNELFNDHGTLYTLGYARTNKARRLRVELFTGTMNYATPATWNSDPLSSSTVYLGARANFELIWDLPMSGCPNTSVFAGVGSRFWIRNLRDGPLPPPQMYFAGHQENWWTLYPYIGLEKKWVFWDYDEIFLSGHVGATACTYEYSSTLNAPSLWPTPGVTGQIELGLRHEQFFMSVYFEAITWSQSAMVRGVDVPDAQMYITGLKLGLSF